MSTQDKSGQALSQKHRTVPALEFIILGDLLAYFTFVIKFAIKVATQLNLNPLFFTMS